MKKPTVFGKYLLLERINVGGMAEVFIAKAFGVEGFERILAIKKILPTMAEDHEFISMFIDEARISVQLNHANIVHIHELGKYNEHFYIAMEYVAGKDIRSLLERYRRRREIMPTAQAVYIASRMCEGLDHAHRKRDARGQELGIIHRDISPQNILISFEGEVKIIDFGIAKAANRSQKTQAGILKGKFGYMSPEQVRGMPIDRRSDVFAVGVILYEMLTGEKLFVGESDFSTLEKVRSAEVALPTQFNPNIPAGLERVVLKALAREPEDRYQWASDLQEDLMRFLLAGDQIYSAKHLAAFLNDAFAEDVAREAERMERFATVERPEQIEITGVITSVSRTPRRPEFPQDGPPSGPQAVPPPSIPPPSAAELAERATGDKTQIVSDDLSVDPADGKTLIASTEAFERALEERKAQNKVIIGDEGAAYSGETIIGPVPSQLRNDAQTGKADVVEASVSTRAERVVRGAARSWDDPPHAIAPDQATRMIAADLREDSEESDDRWNDVRTPREDRTDAAARSPRAAYRRARDGAATGTFWKLDWATVRRAAGGVMRLPPGQRLLILGGTGAVLLLVLMMLGIALSGEGSATVQVTVTPPEAAQLRVNGEPKSVGETLTLEPGTYELTASAPDFKSETRRIEAVEGENPPIAFVLQPGPRPAAPVAIQAEPEPTPVDKPRTPATFTARFVSDVDGVEITLDDQVVGTTPDVRATALEVGVTYSFTATAAGYKPLQGELKSTGDAVLDVPVRLEKVPAPSRPREAPRRTAQKSRTVAATARATGTLACSTLPAGAQVWVDGKFTGRETPIAQGSPLILPVGNRVIQFKMGNKKSAPRMIEIKRGELSKLVGVPLE
ncbi:MAG: protein kinase [Myxococcaceae bacterium]